ncbi:hypothetical protein [Flagellimonas myxillae]|uniref:hypothetical protein n=1 Tax=Flagellimonas myxillae TaxID=2942214 RepID=UPI00201FAE80|nr:hypothetical protein [Muricauda myxillae]MCL6267514.1 hypothetical protein [Muricauda myxillae]
MSKVNLSSDSFLDSEFSKIQAAISHRDALSPKVSKVDVAWHLDHMLKTIIFICNALAKSNPAEYKSSFNLTRAIIYTFGGFPRGVAKSPRVVRPPDVILTEEIQQQIVTAKESLKTLKHLDENVHFNHPYFNILNKKQSIRFIKIHTGHHLKIVRDIIKKA